MYKKCLFIAIAGAILLLTGCAPMWNVKAKVENLQASEGKIAIVDKRPPTETQDVASFSWLATNCAFGISRIGDGRFFPNRLRLLQHRAYEKFAQSAPKSIVVYHFAAYLNTQAYSRTHGMLAGAGGAGLMVVNPKSINDFYGGSNSSLCDDQEAVLGFYTKEEQSTINPVAVVHLEAEIDGVRKYIRQVKAAASKYPEYEDLLSTATEGAIKKFLDNY